VKTVEIAFEGDVKIQLMLEDREVLGIGKVSVGEVELRDGSRPIRPHIDTPHGVHYERFHLVDVEEDGSGQTCVQTMAEGRRGIRGEYADQYQNQLVFPSAERGPIEDKLEWLLAPATLVLGGRQWFGFSYNWRFRSEERHVHRLLVESTWEIGGRITGNTLLHQGQVNPPVYEGSAESAFTTCCLKTLDRLGDPGGVSYQLGPRGGLVQAFDFQYSQQGALFQYWPDLGSIRSLIEKPKGADVLFILDEMLFTLDKKVTTPAKCVLFTPPGEDWSDSIARDLWLEAHQFAYGRIREKAGVELTVPKPEVGHSYSTYVKDDRLRIKVAGQDVPPEEMLYALADHALPKLAQQGIKRLFPSPVHESDVSEHGYDYKLQEGLHGDLHVSSVCAPHRYRPAEFWGGMEAWKYLARKAHEVGIELGIWVGLHLSHRAPILKEHPEYAIQDVNTMPHGGGYGWKCIVSMDWHSGVRDWIFNDIKAWKEEGGIDYVFIDSWANMGLLPRNYAEHMRTNWEPLNGFFSDLQRIGIHSISFEGISPFGYSRIGMADLRSEAREPMPGVVGQNDWGWWLGNEDMACGMLFCVSPMNRSEQQMREALFRMCASRAQLIYQGVGQWPELPGWWAELNHLYLQALPFMQMRSLLPEGKGVLWRSAQAQVLFAYTRFSWPIPQGKIVYRLEGPERKGISVGESLTAEPYTAYLITSAG